MLFCVEKDTHDSKIYRNRANPRSYTSSFLTTQMSPCIHLLVVEIVAKGGKKVKWIMPTLYHRGPWVCSDIPDGNFSRVSNGSSRQSKCRIATALSPSVPVIPTVCADSRGQLQRESLDTTSHKRGMRASGRMYEYTNDESMEPCPQKESEMKTCRQKNRNAQYTSIKPSE